MCMICSMLFGQSTDEIVQSDVDTLIWPPFWNGMTHSKVFDVDRIYRVYCSFIRRNMKCLLALVVSLSCVLLLINLSSGAKSSKGPKVTDKVSPKLLSWQLDGPCPLSFAFASFGACTANRLDQNKSGSANLTLSLRLITVTDSVSVWVSGLEFRLSLRVRALPLELVGLVTGSFESRFGTIISGVDLGGIPLSREPQISRRNTRFAGTVIRPGYQFFPRFGDLILGLASSYWPTCLNR